MTLNQKMHAAKIRVLEASKEYWYANGDTDEHNELMEAVAELVGLETELKDADSTARTLKVTADTAGTAEQSGK